MRVLLVKMDNDSFISVFPVGIGYLASACRNAGHEVIIYNQDVYHWPDSHLLDLLNKEKFDVLGIGIVGGYYQYRKLLKVSKVINESKNRPFFLLGGHGVAPEAEYFLKKTAADVVVRGEGENTLVDLLNALEMKRDLSTVDGIGYMKEGKFVETPPRELIKNIDNIPFPAWDLFPMEHYVLERRQHIKNSERSMRVISARGCTFKCNFCYRMDKGYRARSAESLLAEVEVLQRKYQVSYIEFVDELLMSSVEKTINLCEKFLKSKLKFRWSCNGRLNYATPEVLKIMKKSGCVFINYGIESMDDEILKVMKKNLTVKQITRGVENTLEAGISPGLNIIFGNIGETAEILQRGVDFILKYGGHSQRRTIKPVTPYPGSPLYDYAIEKGLVKDCEDFYENKHTNIDLVSINFTNLTDDEFHKALYDANARLLKSYSEEILNLELESIKKLYFENDVNFRGFRKV